MTCMSKTSVAMALTLALTAGYATGPAVGTCGAYAVQAAAPVQLAEIESIQATGEGEAAELLIKLSAPAVYTSYKTTDPLRLVLDLSQTTPGALTAPLVIDKGNFRNITVTRFDTDAGVLTRVTIELAHDAVPVISASQARAGELRIGFHPQPSQSTGSEQEAGDAAAAPPAPASSPAAAGQAADGAPSVVREHLLKAVTVNNGSIVLAVEGGVQEFKSFRLTSPERFVLDLFNVGNALPDRFIPLHVGGSVASARIGVYPDKVRIVFDSLQAPFPETTVSRSPEGVVIALASGVADRQSAQKSGAEASAQAGNGSLTSGARLEPDGVASGTPPLTTARSGQMLRSAEPTAERSERAVVTPPPPAVTPETTAPVRPAAAPEPPEKGRPVVQASVGMIDFQVVGAISRLAVQVTGDAVIEAPVASPGFVTLTIKNALLPKRLQRSLDTRAFVSPVLRVTPVAVRSRKGTDTRIRVAMRSPAPYEFRREGDVVYLEFKTPEGMTAEQPFAGLGEGKVAPAPRNPNLAAGQDDGTASGDAVPPVAGRGTPSYRGRKVTLEFADAEVRKIFQLLSEVSNKNFVLGDEVGGTISIKLVNVPWDQALDIILDTKGLDKREDGNIIIIKGKGKFKSQAEEELELKKALNKSLDLRSETFSVNYADIGSIAGQFAGLKSERGVITQDVRTNKVIVKDIPQALEDMRTLLQQLDVPEKQVMIEARIVEATSTFTRSIGVNWGVHYKDSSANFLGINSLDTGFGGVAATAPPAAGTGADVAGGTMGISFGTLGSNVNVSMRLNAAASAGLIKIVSTPKVATLNNKTAKITQGQQIPYTSATSDKTETKFVEAALALEVTPHINANGTIGLKIDAKNDSPGAVPVGSTAPAINKKQATTEMLLRDGETTVIGGIYIDNDTESDDGVPFLMDIPFLGKLFKSNTKSKTKTELLIFITPRILSTT
jgi:type IV pilus assembly protein PilQ